MEYVKPWLSIGEQIEKLASKGVRIGDRGVAGPVLREVGYYRLTGYLYPFRESSFELDSGGRRHIEVQDRYRAGTELAAAEALIAFDRSLRLLVIEGVERIEVAVRTQVGHVLGEHAPFAHEDGSLFTEAFTAHQADASDGSSPHTAWLQRVRERQDSSDESFVAHFRTKYDDRMPIWALTEILELGHLARLYGGLRNDVATRIAGEFGVPTKKTMLSWLASVNYVRNVAAHHARLFNRKLVVVPKRPRSGAVPLLAHLSGTDAPKQFGVYNTLAVMAYLLRSIPSDHDWAERVAALLGAFPSNEHLDLSSMGVGAGWLDHAIWRGRH
ncbi:Abi family protein [Curtobacterium sp. MCLR17_043]|nr:Abi family protein [Curtobacterium sp. MCLR17_043]